MTLFEQQILLVALHLNNTKPHVIRWHEEDFIDEGRQLFGKDWVKARYSKEGYIYAPRIAMTLGKLAKRGLITRHTYTGMSYSQWLLSDAGFQLATQIMGGNHVEN